QQLTVGDEKGNLYVYDVHENLANCRPDEWSKLSRALRDIRQATEEAEELSEAMNSYNTSSIGISAITNAAVSVAGLSPRQQW
ncbi:unnamed protein product, partial [Onchocerca ochengi]